MIRTIWISLPLNSQPRCNAGPTISHVPEVHPPHAPHRYSIFLSPSCHPGLQEGGSPWEGRGRVVPFWSRVGGSICQRITSYSLHLAWRSLVPVRLRRLGCVALCVQYLSGLAPVCCRFSEGDEQVCLAVCLPTGDGLRGRQLSRDWVDDGDLHRQEHQELELEEHVKLDGIESETAVQKGPDSAFLGRLAFGQCASTTRGAGSSRVVTSALWRMQMGRDVARQKHPHRDDFSKKPDVSILYEDPWIHGWRPVWLRWRLHQLVNAVQPVARLRGLVAMKFLRWNPAL